MTRNRSLEVHAGWGYGIALTMIYFGFAPALGFILAMALGAAFELIQRYITRSGGDDVWDVIYTGIGGVVAMTLGMVFG